MEALQGETACFYAKITNPLIETGVVRVSGVGWFAMLDVLQYTTPPYRAVGTGPAGPVLAGPLFG